MPWKERPMIQQRLEAVHAVRVCHWSVARTARAFGVSRKTLYKWLGRHQQAPEEPLADRSRRPQSSPGQTPAGTAEAILSLRSQTGWGPRKLRASLVARGQVLPSVRTVARILQRHGRLDPIGPPPPPVCWQRFERTEPNALWQMDFKGPREIDRVRIDPLTVLDDHSRYCLRLYPCRDKTMATVWAVLWDLFGEAGLPEAILSDRGFAVVGTDRPVGLSWLDQQLVRLAIVPLHGRVRHPQTQGKVEALHASLERECYPRIGTGDVVRFGQDLERWRDLYNHHRPHEALGDQVPSSRWRPSLRKRPAVLPAVSYPAGATLRRVASSGDIRWQGYRLLVGRGLLGELVRLEEQEAELVISYSWKKVRSIPLDQLTKGRML